MEIKLLNNDIIKYELFDARTIILLSKISPKEIVHDKKIVSLNINDILKISIGDEIVNAHVLIPASYKVNYIKKYSSNNKKYNNYYCYELLESYFNKSYTYLLPILYSKNKFNLNTLFADVYLINTFIDMSKKELILCYKISKSELYKKLEETIFSHELFTRVVTSNNYDYFAFKIPDNNDLQNFIDGKYSNLSKELKQKIKLFFNLNNNDRIIQILKKSKKLKLEMEKTYKIEIPEDVDLDDKPSTKEFIDLDTL